MSHTWLILCLLAVAAAFAARPAMYVFGDIHYDPYYGTNMAVSVDGACNTSSAPKFGVYNCDAPFALLESAIADIFSQAAEDGDGIMLLTGDFVRHKMVDFALANETGDARHRVEYELVGNITATIAKLIEKYQKQLIATTGKRRGLHLVVHPSAYVMVDGNEDCVPHYEFYASTEPSVHPALLRLTASMKDNGLMAQDQAAQFGRCAFYAVSPPETNLIILGINTILYSKQHRPNTTNESDPCGQLAWLEAQLRAAAAAQQRVMVLGHIIPDATKWLPQYLDAYRTLVMNYGDVISVQWFGHTHMFTFLTLSEHKAPPLFDVPGITPRDGNMPSYLKVTFTDQSEYGPLNSSQWLVEDITERFLNITSNPDVAEWQTGLSLPSSFAEYIASPVTTNGLYQFGTSLLTDKKSSTAWEMFQTLYYGGVVAPGFALGKKDKAEVLCKALTASETDYEKCKADNK